MRDGAVGSSFVHTQKVASSSLAPATNSLGGYKEDRMGNEHCHNPEFNTLTIENFIKEAKQIIDEETVRVFNKPKVAKKLGKAMYKARDTFGLTVPAIESAFNIAVQEYKKKLLQKAFKEKGKVDG